MSLRLKSPGPLRNLLFYESSQTLGSRYRFPEMVILNFRHQFVGLLLQPKPANLIIFDTMCHLITLRKISEYKQYVFTK